MINLLIAFVNQFKKKEDKLKISPRSCLRGGGMSSDARGCSDLIVKLCPKGFKCLVVFLLLGDLTLQTLHESIVHAKIKKQQKSVITEKYLFLHSSAPLPPLPLPVSCSFTQKSVQQWRQILSFRPYSTYI